MFTSMGLRHIVVLGGTSGGRGTVCAFMGMYGKVLCSIYDSFKVSFLYHLENEDREVPWKSVEEIT